MTVLPLVSLEILAEFDYAYGYLLAARESPISRLVPCTIAPAVAPGWLWNLGREVLSFSPHQPHIKFKHDEMKRAWRVARAGTG